MHEQQKSVSSYNVEPRHCFSKVFAASLPQNHQSTKTTVHFSAMQFCVCAKLCPLKTLNGNRRIVWERVPSACCSQSKGMCPVLLMLSLNGGDKRAYVHKYRRRARAPTHSENVVLITRHEDGQSVSERGLKKQNKFGTCAD